MGCLEPQHALAMLKKRQNTKKNTSNKRVNPSDTGTLCTKGENTAWGA